MARPRLPPAAAIAPYLERIDEARWYSNFGPLLTEFEARLGERFGPGAHVATAVNATQALALTLQAMDLPRGALCAMPSWTFVATAHAAIQAGLTPWFLDVDPATWMLDPERVREALPRAPGPVAVVMPVAPFGRPMDLGAWLDFRDATGLPVLIDAAAAFDTAADAALPSVVSLHATKVLGIGEGGFLATQDPALAKRVMQLTTYGFQGDRASRFVATNAKLSEYAAAVGLAALDAWPLDRLRWLRAAQMLRMAMADLPQVVFQPGWGSSWITSVCTVGLPEGVGAAVEAGFRSRGVDTRRWWGQGCHESPAFAGSPRDALPHTLELAGSTIGLPFAIDLDVEDARRIAAAMSETLRSL
ncbi:DegT/DnrJ/EryC1/StrS family aminotransferase [Phenylobacterium sp.]|uniref:DegT/DnrJ/EryC1/StrS family aminotransferase n=1 Tax=Phenylobacterium sp. TaxID=1871053 RepID=UPI0035AEC252